MCLPVCPTYDLTMDETSSPRGRIRLIASVREGKLAAGAGFAEEMNFCLDCRACESACPAGVRYGELLEDARERVAGEGIEPLHVRLKKFVVLRLIFGARWRFHLFFRILRWYHRTGIGEALRRSNLLDLFPASWRNSVESLPVASPRPFPGEPDPSRHPEAVSGGVGLLTGCVMSVSFPDIHRDTVQVLERNGVWVRIPPDQFCCGALHAHNGDLETARKMARELLASFPDDLETLVVNSAGCGSFMKEYGRILADDPRIASRAEKFASRVEDISEYLVRRGFQKPHHPVPLRAVYHDPCHLLHGQGISTQPRDILRSIPALTVVELRGPTACCGSAGIYNLLQPGPAGEFLRRKVADILATRPEVVCTANPGCHLQIMRGLRECGSAVAVVHPVSLLNAAYGNTTAKPDFFLSES